jgi:alanyl-tRNA synthetase
VARTGDIGVFKILSESGVAAGVRRIEAVTGEGALDWIAGGEGVLKQVATVVKGTREDLPARVAQLADRVRVLERETDRLRDRLASGGGRDLAQTAVDVGGVKVLATRVDGADGKSLRTLVDQLRNRLGSGVVVIGAVEDDKVRLVAGVTPDLTRKLKAGALIRRVAEQVGGRGGGRDDFAQAGGTEPDKLDAALADVVRTVAETLAAG